MTLSQAVACASLAVIAYAGIVEFAAPDLGLLWPLLPVFVATAISFVTGFAFAPTCAVMRRDVSQRTARHQTGSVLNIHEGSRP